MKLTDRTGEVIAVRPVVEGDGLVLITEGGKILRTPVSGVRRIGRSTQGVRIMDVDEGDILRAAAKVLEREGDDEIAEDLEAKPLEFTDSITLAASESIATTDSIEETEVGIDVDTDLDTPEPPPEDPVN
jgi:DNA gyrase subunit A